MTKSNWDRNLAQRQVHLKADDADPAVKSLLEMMGGALAEGERIEVPGPAASLHFRPPRTGRNPKTGDAVVAVRQARSCTSSRARNCASG